MIAVILIIMTIIFSSAHRCLSNQAVCRQLLHQKYSRGHHTQCPTGCSHTPLLVLDLKMFQYQQAWCLHEYNLYIQQWYVVIMCKKKTLSLCISTCRKLIVVKQASRLKVILCTYFWLLWVGCKAVRCISCVVRCVMLLPAVTSYLCSDWCIISCSHLDHLLSVSALF